MCAAGHLEDHLGDILQKARTGKGFSRADLSNLTGMAPAQIAQIEALAVIPAVSDLQRLATPLNLHTQKLMAIAKGTWMPKQSPDWIQDKVITIGGLIGGYPVNGYILYDEQSREAACIDTAYDPEKMLQSMTAHHLRLKYILLTHCHQDHMGGVEILKKKTGAALYLHRDEMPLFSRQSKLAPDRWVNEVCDILVGRFRVRAANTPGHTSGGTTYITEGLCFVGDALFAGSTGRSMSPQGYEQLLASLRQEVLSLPEQTVIFPGHGPSSTVGEESRHNPFF